VKTVTLFGSSLPQPESNTYRDALRLGQLLAEAGFAVCNGGYGGLMEASARGAHQAGGHTVGITCSLWPAPANRWIREEVRTSSFPQRLMALIERGDAYLVLPGGTGTLAELALAWELMNKSVLAGTVGGRKPLLVWGPYWQPVIDCLNQEARLAPGSAADRPRALDFVTPVESVEQMAGLLQQLHSKTGIPESRH
jgi:uncharacterized protein (TIGR00725 family)